MTPRWFRKRSGPPRSRSLGWRPDSRIEALAASSPGDVFIGTRAGELWHWRPDRDAPHRLYSDGSRMPLVHLTAEGTQVACAWADGRAATFIANEMRPLDRKFLTSASDLVGLLAWPSGGFTWVCASGAVWFSSRERCAPAPMPIAGPLAAVADPDNGRLVVACDDGRLVLWTPRDDGRSVVRLPAPAIRLTCGPGDHVLALDVNGDVHHVHAGRANVLTREPADVTALAVLPGGVLVTGHRLAWADDGPFGEVVARTSRGERRLKMHRDTVLSLDPLSDGRLAAAGADGLVVVWDVPRDRCRVVARHDGPVTKTLAGAVVASASSSVRVWRPAAVEERPEAVRQVLKGPWATSPDGSWVGFDGAGVLRRVTEGGLGMATGVTLDDLQRDPRSAPPGLSMSLRDGFAFAALDGGHVAASIDGRVFVLRRSSPSLGLRLPAGVGKVTCLGAARVGSGWCIAAGSDSGCVLRWLLDEPDALPLPPHPAAVLAVAVLSDGRIATADADGALWLRDPNGTASDMVYTTEEPAVSLAFDEQSFVLSCGLESGAVLRLGIEPEHSRCLSAAVAVVATGVAALESSTVIISGARPKEEEVYPHHRKLRRLDAAPCWTTWLTQTEDGRHWAVRIVRLAGTSFDLAELRRYRRLTAGLPHSQPVEHLERHGDRLTVLMPAPTQTLRERFAGRPTGRRGLPRVALLAWLDAVAEALDDLWQRHRAAHLDVTAANVWLDGERARLCGWGLVPGGLPSSAAIPAGERDGAADLHSLARLYVEARTGRPADEGLSALHPLERDAVGRALDAEPRARFASCRSFLVALRKAAAGIVEAEAASVERFGDGRAVTVFVGGADDADEERAAFASVLRRWRPALSRAGMALDVVTRGTCVRAVPEAAAARLAVFFATERIGLPLDERESQHADTFADDLFRLPATARIRVYYRETLVVAPRHSHARYGSVEELLALLEEDLEALTGLAGDRAEGEQIAKATSKVLLPFLRWQAHRHRTIEVPGLRRAGLREIALDLVYVALRGDPTRIFERVQERDLLEKAGRLRDRPTMLALEERDRPGPGETCDLEEAFLKERCLVILGDPGSGKTTLLRWLTLRLSEATSRGASEAEGLGPARLPVLLRAAEYAEALARGPLSLEDHLGHHGWQGERPRDPDTGHELPARPVNDLIRAHLRSGKAVILLDGLDEVGPRREEVLAAVEAFVEDWVVPGRRVGAANGNQVVLTSRIAGYHAAPLTLRCAAHYTIEPMTRPAVERFLRGWGAATGAPAEEVEALNAAIFDPATPGVAELASSPLLVTVLALVYRSRKGLPPRRAELYEEAIRALVSGWPDVPPGDLEPLAEVLGPIAWHVHEHYPTGLIEEAELLERLRAASAVGADFQSARSGGGGQVGNLPPRAWRMRPEELVATLRENVGLLAERAEGLFGFLHLTFQEYFVALEMIRDRDVAAAKMLDRLLDPRWREPILLALGLASRRWPSAAFHALLAALLDGDPARAARLLVRALPEVGDLPRPLVKRISRLLASDADASLLRVRRAAPDATEDALCEALADPDRAAPTAQLIQQMTWYSPRVAEALLDALPHDDDESHGFPIASCLRELVSPAAPPRPLAAPPAEEADARHRILARLHPTLKLREELRQRCELPLAGLPFRAAVQAAPHVEGTIRSHVGWLSLIGAIYGGYADHQAAAIEAEHARLAAFLRAPDAVREAAVEQQPEEYLGRFGAADPIYQAAVYLDNKMAGRHAHARAPVAFAPAAIWRDATAAMTRRVLDVLRAEGQPRDAVDDLRRLWHRGDAAALAGLAAMGEASVIGELDAAHHHPTGRQALRAMAAAGAGLRDAVVRSVPLVLRAVADLASLPGEVQEVAAALLRAVSRAADVPPDLAQVAAVASPPLRGALLADGWHRLARGWGVDDPLFAAKSLSDSMSDAALIEALTAAHLAPSRRACPEVWPVEPIPALSDETVQLEAVEALLALRLDQVPPEQQARLRGDLMARLGLPDPLAARRLNDPYRRCRALLRLLDAAPDDELLLAEARTTALAIADPLSRCRVRERLLRFGEDLASVAADAQSIVDADERCRAFARLLARADHETREALLAQAFGAVTFISDDRRRANVLALLLPLTPSREDHRAAAATLPEWQRARARELEGLYLADRAELAPYVAAAPEAWAAVLAYAALTDVVAHWRSADEDDWEAFTVRRPETIRKLLDRGEDRGLTLTLGAARALGAMPGADAATALLPLMQMPEAEAWPALDGWLSHPDERLRQHALLLRAEAHRRLDETTIPALASLLGSGLDRSRLRAGLLLRSSVLAVEKDERGLRVSQLGRRAIDALASAHADLSERGEVVAARGLFEFWGDVIHDDPEALAAWADQAARPGRESAQALWVLGNVEELSPEAWPAFRRLLGESRPLPVRTALLRSLCALAYVEGKLPPAEWLVLRPELDRFRQEDWSGLRTFVAPENVLLEALRAARHASEGERAAVAEQALAGMTMTFAEILSLEGDDLLATLRRLGRRFYLPMRNDAQAERLAEEVEREPALFAVLADWLRDSLAGAADDGEGWHPKRDWLLRVTAAAAERMPAAFLRQAPDAARWRSLLARAVQRQDGKFGRRGAVVLLGLLREATPAVTNAFRGALRDAPAVQDAALRAAERFSHVDDEALEAFVALLDDESATTAYGAARVLSALGRSARRPAAQRRRIIEGLTAALGRPLAWRSVYRLLGRGSEREPVRIVRGVRLEAALRQALAEVGGWA